MDLNSLAENTTAQGDTAYQLESLYDMVMNGGPVMVPIGLCSVVALGYTVERFVRLAPAKIGNRRFGQGVLEVVREGGPDPGLEACHGKSNPLSRILAEALRRWRAGLVERDKAVEDAGAREVHRMAANLRPLQVVAMLAPLLGLLGTVWGMIQAFSKLAAADSLAKPELLASGISQALVTTAAGLAIAIPTQAAYFYFRGRIDRFTRMVEDIYVELGEIQEGRDGGGHANS
ncbi:MAG: MotA/TolQ/ExbB proton channel family protein [Planctomycetota bacterium]|nr:MAG: MotA/TolQ/ExbB proton channel family protein [Planctomycetota bacterium]